MLGEYFYWILCVRMHGNSLVEGKLDAVSFRKSISALSRASDVTLVKIKANYIAFHNDHADVMLSGTELVTTTLNAMYGTNQVKTMTGTEMASKYNCYIKEVLFRSCNFILQNYMRLSDSQYVAALKERLKEIEHEAKIVTPSTDELAIDRRSYTLLLEENKLLRLKVKDLEQRLSVALTSHLSNAPQPIQQMTPMIGTQHLQPPNIMQGPSIPIQHPLSIPLDINLELADDELDEISL